MKWDYMTAFVTSTTYKPGVFEVAAVNGEEKTSHGLGNSKDRQKWEDFLANAGENEWELVDFIPGSGPSFGAVFKREKQAKPIPA